MKINATGLETNSETSRLEAFSDGVMAVIITVMVLELKAPSGANLTDLAPLLPKLLVYVLSFAFIGIYWNNHHHLLRATRRISVGIMWANLHLLFWLSLIPIVTSWVGEHPSSSVPAAVYGFIGTLSGAAYTILSLSIVRANPETSIEEALRDDTKGKICILLYVTGTAAAFVNPLISYTLYTMVSILWLIPDRRLEKIK